jgi:hypothetical protein
MKENFIYIWLGWGLFGLGSFLFFRFNKNARIKRVAFPVIQIIATAAFLFIVWNMWEGEIGAVFFVFSAIAIAIGVSNYRRAAFCDSCGAMSYSGSMFKRPTDCTACGSKWV